MWARLDLGARGALAYERRAASPAVLLALQFRADAPQLAHLVKPCLLRRLRRFGSSSIGDGPTVLEGFDAIVIPSSDGEVLVWFKAREDAIEAGLRALREELEALATGPRSQEHPPSSEVPALLAAAQLARVALDRDLTRVPLAPGERACKEALSDVSRGRGRWTVAGQGGASPAALRQAVARAWWPVDASARAPRPRPVREEAARVVYVVEGDEWARPAIGVATRGDASPLGHALLRAHADALRQPSEGPNRRLRRELGASYGMWATVSLADLMMGAEVDPAKVPEASSAMGEGLDEYRRGLEAGPLLEAVRGTSVTHQIQEMSLLSVERYVEWPPPSARYGVEIGATLEEVESISGEGLDVRRASVVVLVPRGWGRDRAAVRALREAARSGALGRRKLVWIRG